MSEYGGAATGLVDLSCCRATAMMASPMTCPLRKPRDATHMLLPAACRASLSPASYTAMNCWLAVTFHWLPHYFRYCKSTCFAKSACKTIRRNFPDSATTRWTESPRPRLLLWVKESKVGCWLVALLQFIINSLLGGAPTHPNDGQPTHLHSSDIVLHTQIHYIALHAGTLASTRALSTTTRTSLR